MNFSSAVKYLDIVKARKTTSSENTAAQPSLSKFNSVVKARHIHKLQQQLILQAHRVVSGALALEGRLLFQYNVTMPSAFTLNYNYSPQDFGGYLTVKWRVGTTVTRYYLLGTDVIQMADGQMRYAPELYANQVIPVNCVFEFWFAGPPLIPVGLSADLSLGVARLVNPSTVNDTSSILKTVAAIDIATFGVILPEILPYTQADQVWLTN